MQLRFEDHIREIFCSLCECARTFISVHLDGKSPSLVQCSNFHDADYENCFIAALHSLRVLSGAYTLCRDGEENLGGTIESDVSTMLPLKPLGSLDIHCWWFLGRKTTDAWLLWLLGVNLVGTGWIILMTKAFVLKPFVASSRGSLGSETMNCWWILTAVQWFHGFLLVRKAMISGGELFFWNKLTDKSDLVQLKTNKNKRC